VCLMGCICMCLCLCAYAQSHSKLHFSLIHQHGHVDTCAYYTCFVMLGELNPSGSSAACCTSDALCMCIHLLYAHAAHHIACCTVTVYCTASNVSCDVQDACKTQQKLGCICFWVSSPAQYQSCCNLLMCIPCVLGFLIPAMFYNLKCWSKLCMDIVHQTPCPTILVVVPYASGLLNSGM